LKIIALVALIIIKLQKRNRKYLFFSIKHFTQWVILIINWQLIFRNLTFAPCSLQEELLSHSRINQNIIFLFFLHIHRNSKILKNSDAIQDKIISDFLYSLYYIFIFFIAGWCVNNKIYFVFLLLNFILSKNL